MELLATYLLLLLIFRLYEAIEFVFGFILSPAL